MKSLGFYRKWIKGECRHICLFCRHKQICKEQKAEENRLKQRCDVTHEGSNYNE